MLQEYGKLFRRLLMIFDGLIFIICFLCAYQLRNLSFFSGPHGLLYPLEMYTPLLLVAISLFLILLGYFQMYSKQTTASLSLIVIVSIKSIGFGFILLSGFSFILKLTFVSRTFLFLFSLLSLSAIVIVKVSLSMLIQYLSDRPTNQVNIIICGNASKALELISLLKSDQDLRYNIIGFVPYENSHVESSHFEEHEIKILGNLQQLEQIVRNSAVDEVIFTLNKNQIPDIEDFIHICEEVGVTFRIVANFFRLFQSKTTIESYHGLPILTYSTVPTNSNELVLKRFIDFLGSIFIMVIFLPIHIIIAAAIKIDSRGSIFYRQLRVGQNGRQFMLYKFRSMVQDAEEMKNKLVPDNEMTGPVFKIRNDPRVTRVGRFLRKYSLDEIPQIINVIRGEMSLVGPRPPLPEEVAQYDLWQRRRLSMKPGLTCLWQVKGRSDIDFIEWMKLDLEYIDNWSLGLDLLIILKTIPAILTARGAF